MSAPSANPVVTKEKRESEAGAEKVKRPCKHCDKNISCAVRPSGKIHEASLRAHEKKCPKNPNRVVKSVRGLKVSALFGPIGSDAEFQAPEGVRKLTQGSTGALEGAVHVFSDGSSHPVVGKLNGKTLRAELFFFYGNRCCYEEADSMLMFRIRPDLFPKMYTEEGKCVIAQIGTEKTGSAPAPWSISTLRRYPLHFNDKLEVFCIGCKEKINMRNNDCANGHGPCRNCASNKPDIVVYNRSLQAYFDRTGRKWTTVPDANIILANHKKYVQFACTVCAETWTRSPHSQVQQNCGCPGCDARHLAELCAYELYQFVFPEADMYPRGQARLEGVHKNPFDVTSTNIKVIVEVMSFGFHVEKGKLPNDVEKMLAVLRAGYVYIMVHSEDYDFRPERELAWKRCIVAARRLAKEDATPRMIHVRRDATWDAYDCMRDAALAAEFPYQDIFCGDVNANAAERLPGETHTQTTLPV
jgi:hypothetical protein